MSISQLTINPGKPPDHARRSTTLDNNSEKYVRDHYAEQIRACRSSRGRSASALLIVIVDADSKPTHFRAAQLAEALDAHGEAAVSGSEPIVVLIPKRNVETWIRAVLGSSVDESTDYKNPVPTSGEIRSAAAKLFQSTRTGVHPPIGYPPSLIDSIPQWQKIPS